MSEGTVMNGQNGAQRSLADTVFAAVNPSAAPASAPPLVLTPRTGGEADWPTPPGGLPKPPDFGSWPVSAPKPPSERHPIVDIAVAALIALVVAASAALYVTGTFSHTHDPRPAAPNDPFEVGG